MYGLIERRRVDDWLQHGRFSLATYCMHACLISLIFWHVGETSNEIVCCVPGFPSSQAGAAHNNHGPTACTDTQPTLCRNMGSVRSLVLAMAYKF